MAIEIQQDPQVPSELTDKLNKLLNRAEEIAAEIQAKASSEDVSTLKDEQDKLRDELNEVHRERETAKAKAENDELMKFVADIRDQSERRPSKAGLIGNLGPDVRSETNFFAAVAQAQSRDMEQQAEGKARLREIGSTWASVPSDSKGSLKATLGTTDAAGGYLIPNNLVTQIQEHATADNPYRRLLTVINGVRGTAVDVPVEGLSPTRAVVAAWGATKANADFTVANYTATLYTLAAIMDVSNQFLRHSEGAAERLVRSILSRRMALGEAYYILNGSGTNEPKGILTSVGTSGEFVTSFTASGTTLAGSIARALTEAAGDLAGRNRVPDGAVLHAGAWWDMLAQGTDTAGFFFSPTGGPTDINATIPSVRVFGVPVYPDANMPLDDLLVGEFRSAFLFIGEDLRVDTSSEAADRWDQNLTGFRVEEEVAFNADPYVVSGHFQRILDILP